MTKKETINRNIGLTFDFIRQVIKDSTLLDKIQSGSTLEFVDKDFVKKENKNFEKRTTKRTYLKVKSELEMMDNEKLFLENPNVSKNSVIKDLQIRNQNEKKLYDLMCKAIIERRMISFYYESKGGKYHRKVEPYLMAIKENGNIYVTGYEYASKERTREKNNDRQGQYLLKKIDLDRFKTLEETFDSLKIPSDRIFGKLRTVKVICRVDKKAVHID